jgi:hypothetical protein
MLPFENSVFMTKATWVLSPPQQTKAKGNQIKRDWLYETATRLPNVNSPIYRDINDDESGPNAEASYKFWTRHSDR